jgi:hypothetical protein
VVFDIVLVTLGLANAAGLGYLAYAIARSREDTPTLVAEAVDDAVKRQDDRIRKRMEREPQTDNGQAPEQAWTGIMPGVPLRR